MLLSLKISPYSPPTRRSIITFGLIRSENLSPSLTMCSWRSCNGMIRFERNRRSYFKAFKCAHIMVTEDNNRVGNPNSEDSSVLLLPFHEFLNVITFCNLRLYLDVTLSISISNWWKFPIRGRGGGPGGRPGEMVHLCITKKFQGNKVEK